VPRSGFVAAIASGAALAARSALLADGRKAQTLSTLRARTAVGAGAAVVRILLGVGARAEQGP
jgi:hypothetical protein